VRGSPDPAHGSDRRSPGIAVPCAASGDLRSASPARSGDLRRARARRRAVRGSPNSSLCAGLPTRRCARVSRPRTRLTEGLPESPRRVPLRETYGQQVRRGRETCAEQRGALCAGLPTPHTADRRSPRIAAPRAASGDLRSAGPARSGDLRRARRRARCARVSRPRTRLRPKVSQNCRAVRRFGRPTVSRSGEVGRPAPSSAERCARVSRPRTRLRPKVSQNRRTVRHFGRPTVSSFGEVGRPAPSTVSSFGEVGRPAPSTSAW
jgi:hypothetical protein